MGLTDELEALRQAGSVKSKSADLAANVAAAAASSASSTASFTIITPESEAERRREKTLQEKQSRLEAKRALHSNNYGGEDDLNSILLNKKLIEEQREKKKEAERNLREWRRKHHDGSCGGGVGDRGKRRTEDSATVEKSGAEEEDDEEARMNRDALDMLPEHVVRTLKAKYETNNAELALERALHDVEVLHGNGKGKALAKWMEITLEEEDEDDDNNEENNIDDDNLNENDKNEELTQPQQSPGTTVDEEWVKVEGKYHIEKERTNDDIQAKRKEDGVVEPVEVAVEEVREKIEQLSIDEDKKITSSSDAERLQGENKVVDRECATDANERINDMNDANIQDQPSYVSKKYDVQIERTKRFYNVHFQEYINFTSGKSIDGATIENAALGSDNSHRENFIAHILRQQQPPLMGVESNSNPINSSSMASSSLLLLDLGCGYGRDTYYFTTTLGHRVLGIDYSIEMLRRAKHFAPLAHYLNMDMRQLKHALVDESLDGIWANSSLLHLPKCDMFHVLQDLHAAIKVGGILFLSLKMMSNDVECTAERGGEVFKIDERYAPSNISLCQDSSSTQKEEEVEIVSDDTRQKLYSYYTIEEVGKLVTKSGWEILELKDENHCGMSEYATHSKIYVFATRRKEREV